MTAYSKGSSVTAAGKLLTERLRAARDSHPERPRLVYYLGDGEQTSAAAPAARCGWTAAWSTGEPCWATAQPKVAG